MTTLTIPYGVTSIEAFAFYLSTLITLTIPNSVTTIGETPFKNIVNNLNTNVTMPRAFNNNSSKDRIFG